MANETMKNTSLGSWLKWVAGIVVVLVVGATLLPVRIHNGAGPTTIAISSVKQCARGLIAYTADYDDIIPYVHDSAQLVGLTHKYIRRDDLWDTRNGKNPGKFQLNMCLAGSSLIDIEHPELTPGLYDPYGRRPENRPDEPLRFVMSFIDGHAKVQNQDQWRESAKYFSLKLKKYGKPLN